MSKSGIAPRQATQSIALALLTGYPALGVRLITGLISYRIVYEYLDPDDFGLWGMLWALTSYGTILDFGLGITAQKRTAERLANHEWQRLSDELSTMIFAYGVVALAFAFVIFFVPSLLMPLFGGAGQAGDEMSRSASHFLTMFALCMPLSVTSGVLRGLQLQHWDNTLGAIASVAALTVTVVCVHLSMSLGGLLLACLGAMLTQPIGAILLIKRFAPAIRLRITRVRPSLISSTVRFSLSAYLVTVCLVVMMRSGVLVAGTMLSLKAAALYHPAARIAEFYWLLFRQLGAAIQPVATARYGSKDPSGVRALIVGGVRATGLACLPAAIILILFFEPIARLLTGLEEIPRDMMGCGRLLIAWSCSVLITHGIYRPIALMTGHERATALVGVADAVGALGLSSALAAWGWGLSGIAAGLLLAGSAIGWGIVWPMAAMDCGLSSWSLIRIGLARGLVAALPTGLVALIWILFEEGSEEWLLVKGTTLVLVAMVSAWTIGFEADEREVIRRKIVSWRPH